MGGLKHTKMSAGSVELRLVGIQLSLVVAKAKAKSESLKLDPVMFQKNLSPPHAFGSLFFAKGKVFSKTYKGMPRGTLGSPSGCPGFVLSMLQIPSFQCLHRKGQEADEIKPFAGRQKVMCIRANLYGCLTSSFL